MCLRLVKIGSRDKSGEKAGNTARFDQSSPKQFDHPTALIVKWIWWSAQAGRGCST